MPMRALIVISFAMSATPGVPRWTGSVTPCRRISAIHPVIAAGVEAHLRRHVRGERLLLEQHLEQPRSRDVRVAVRVARHADRLEGVAELVHRPEQREPVVERARILGVAAHHERLAEPARLGSGRAAPARCAASRIMCADRCGTASWPACDHLLGELDVDSMPWLGEAVTVTLDRGGSASATSSAFLQRDQLELRTRRRARAGRARCALREHLAFAACRASPPPRSTSLPCARPRVMMPYRRAEP